MASIISNTELKYKLEKILPSCSSLSMISAFVSRKGVSWLQELISLNKPEVNIVGRFTPSDFVNGASDVQALRDCLDYGYNVKALFNLHAKIYQVDDVIYSGSANLTGKGLALVSNSNLEACCQIDACDTTKAFIRNIVNSSVSIDSSMLLNMENFLKNCLSRTVIPSQWPDDILCQSQAIFVSDFPLGIPGEIIAEYTLNPSLPFAQIECFNIDDTQAKRIFKNSKAYLWLKRVISENKGRDLGFGAISSLLHNELIDDPRPYRKDIKQIQANFYKYIKLYASDEVEIYVPKAKSEIIRLRV